MRNKRLDFGTIRAGGNSGKAYQKVRCFRRGPPKFAYKFVSTFITLQKCMCAVNEHRDPAKRHNKETKELSRSGCYPVLGRGS